MKNNWPIKKLDEMKKAWIVHWGFHSQDENKSLKKIGIENKIIDIISVRKKFDEIVDIAKEIYMREMLSISEKIYIANYNRGKERRVNFLKNIPIFTHYKSKLYKDLIKETENNIQSKKASELREKWSKYTEYIIIGHNPYLKICKVFNLVVSEDEQGCEILEWDYKMRNGNTKHIKYEIKK
jgi:hypothetical protein